MQYFIGSGVMYLKYIIGAVFLIVVIALHYFEQRMNLIELGYLKYFLISAAAVFSIVRGFREISGKHQKS